MEVIQLPEITIGDLIYPTPENKLDREYIAEFGIIFGSCIHTAFSIRNPMGKVSLPIVDFQHYCIRLHRFNRAQNL
jgi:hypothetical protein